MEPTVSASSALAQLQNAGSVQLPGKPAMWSNLLRILFAVLMGLVGLLAVGALVFFVVAAIWQTVPITAGTVFGLIGVCIMLFFAGALLAVGYRKQNKLREVEYSPVLLEPKGMTLRGIGPIAWQDFGPAEYQMVPAERDSGFVRRAVMALSASGLVTVNERLPEDCRFRISPATGPFWNREHRWIYLPGVDGLKEREVMELINTAHMMYSRTTDPS